MRYAAAYLLAILGGNPSPDVAAIAKIIESVGIECDKTRAQQVIDACQGKNVEELIANGLVKIQSTSTPTPSLNDNPKIVTPVPGPSSDPPEPQDNPIDDPNNGDDPSFFSLFD